MHEDCTNGNVAHGGGSVHVWSGISHMGKTSLCVLDKMSLADDSARHHPDCVVDAYLQEQDIMHMDWAPYRPDMN